MESLIAATASAGAAVFAGVTLLVLRKQTQILAEQSRMQGEQTRLMFAASELTFNLDVMVRLDDVLLQIAEDPTTQHAIWGDAEGHSVADVMGESVLDVLAMALKACARLPGFASNEEDWTSYAEFVMDSSPGLRQKVLDFPKWWPEVTPYAESALRPKA